MYIHTIHKHTQTMYQWYDKRFFEAEATCDGEDRVETGEHGGEENDLSNARVDGKVGKVVAEGSQLLITSKSILVSVCKNCAHRT